MSAKEDLLAAWEKREGPVVFTTVDNDGIPNAIYATCVSAFNGESLVVADNYFHKTRANSRNGGTGTVLFITGEGKAFQVKGEISYHTDGPVFDDMKTWNPEQHPGHAAAAVAISEAYSGAEKLL